MIFLNMGYKVISTRSYFLEINNKLRSNPDLDEYIYSHPELGPMFTLYSSDNPQNISDVIIKQIIIINMITHLN